MLSDIFDLTYWWEDGFFMILFWLFIYFLVLFNLNRASGYLIERSRLSPGKKRVAKKGASLFWIAVIVFIVLVRPLYGEQIFTALGFQTRTILYEEPERQFEEEVLTPLQEELARCDLKVWITQVTYDREYYRNDADKELAELTLESDVIEQWYVNRGETTEAKELYDEMIRIYYIFKRYEKTYTYKVGKDSLNIVFYLQGSEFAIAGKDHTYSYRRYEDSSFLDEWVSIDSETVYFNITNKTKSSIPESNKSSGGSSSSGRNSSNTKKDDPYDVYDYDDADDFADEWAEEFGDGDEEDGWDDAYEYWEDSRE